jgi:hypothetical protein
VVRVVWVGLHMDTTLNPNAANCNKKKISKKLLTTLAVYANIGRG